MKLADESELIEGQDADLSGRMGVILIEMEKQYNELFIYIQQQMAESLSMTQAIAQLPMQKAQLLNSHRIKKMEKAPVMLTPETLYRKFRTSLLSELIDQQSFTIRPAFTTAMTLPSAASRAPFKEEPETQHEHADAQEEEELQYSPQFWSHIFPEYSFQELLTESESSLIWLGRGKNSAQRLVLKITQRIQSESSRRIHQQEERAFLQKIRIKQMVEIKDIIDQQDYRLLVMKYYPWNAQDLAKKILASSKKRYTQTHLHFILFIFKAILEAVKELHQTGFIHRDLKLDNIMLDSQYRVYLNDFELVTKENQIDRSLAGTIDYMPPERLSLKKRSTIPIRREVDVWSLGVILYELCTGVTPYNALTADELEQQIYSKNVHNSQIPLELMKLIQGMLQIRAEKRLTIPEILDSPIFKSEISKDVMEQSKQA